MVGLNDPELGTEEDGIVEPVADETVLSDEAEVIEPEDVVSVVLVLVEADVVAKLDVVAVDLVDEPLSVEVVPSEVTLLIVLAMLVDVEVVERGEDVERPTSEVLEALDPVPNDDDDRVPLLAEDIDVDTPSEDVGVETAPELVCKDVSTEVVGEVFVDKVSDEIGVDPVLADVRVDTVPTDVNDDVVSDVGIIDEPSLVCSKGSESERIKGAVSAV